MSWENTIMGDSRIKELLNETHYTTKGWAYIKERQPLLRGRAIAKAQAEITFKAGRKDLIREVIEFLCIGENEVGFYEICNHIDFSDWQSKLKEWGVIEGG